MNRHSHKMVVSAYVLNIESSRMLNALTRKHTHTKYIYQFQWWISQIEFD